jgi:hypothetical protein
MRSVHASRHIVLITRYHDMLLRWKEKDISDRKAKFDIDMWKTKALYAELSRMLDDENILE